MPSSNNGSQNIKKLNSQEDGSSSVKTDIEEDTSSVKTDTEEDTSIRPYLTCRDRLCILFDSHKFHVAVVALVLIDCVIVIAELILEAKLHEMQDKTLPHVLHYMSVGILAVFIVEICLKIFAFRCEFFHHKLEVFDAVVIFLSFGLDIAYWEQEGIDLIILLRLWRVARILNGVVMTVKTQSEHKLLKERQLREGIEQELTKCRIYTTALEHEVEMLHSLLLKHGIKEVPLSVVSQLRQNTISVVAEVNKMQPVV